MSMEKRRFGDLEAGALFAFTDEYREQYFYKEESNVHGQPDPEEPCEHYYLLPGFEVYVWVPDPPRPPPASGDKVRFGSLPEGATFASPEEPDYIYQKNNSNAFPRGEYSYMEETRCVFENDEEVILYIPPGKEKSE